MRQERHGLHPSPACTGSTAPAELTAVADMPARPRQASVNCARHRSVVDVLVGSLAGAPLLALGS